MPCHLMGQRCHAVSVNTHGCCCTEKLGAEVKELSTSAFDGRHRPPDAPNSHGSDEKGGV